MPLYLQKSRIIIRLVQAHTHANVEMLFKCARIPLRAAVTYIRRLFEKRTFFLYIVMAYGGALAAKTAGFLLITCALIAKITRIVTFGISKLHLWEMSGGS